MSAQIDAIFENAESKTSKELIQMIYAVPEEERKLSLDQIKQILIKENKEEAQIPAYKLLNDQWFKNNHISNGLQVLLDRSGLKIDTLDERSKYNFALHKLHLGLIALVQGNIDSYLSNALNEVMLGTFGKFSDWKLTHTTMTAPTHYDSLQLWHKIELERNPECRLVFLDQVEKEQPGMTDSQPTTNPYHVHLGFRVSDDVVYSLL